MSASRRPWAGSNDARVKAAGHRPREAAEAKLLGEAADPLNETAWCSRGVEGCKGFETGHDCRQRVEVVLAPREQTTSAACSAAHRARASPRHRPASARRSVRRAGVRVQADSLRDPPCSFVMENVPGMLDMTTRDVMPMIDALTLMAQEGGMGTFLAMRRSHAEQPGSARRCARCGLRVQQGNRSQASRATVTSTSRTSSFRSSRTPDATRVYSRPRTPAHPPKAATSPLPGSRAPPASSSHSTSPQRTHTCRQILVPRAIFSCCCDLLCGDVWARPEQLSLDAGSGGERLELRHSDAFGQGCLRDSAVGVYR